MTSEGARIRDLESRNGTLVNGVRIIDAFLPVGARISLGQSTLRFDLVQGANVLSLSSNSQFGSLVGTSDAMRSVFAVLETAATSTATILLTGETGTGKGEAAESIHRMSSRSGGPFVVVDCGALQANLIESELFGHEKGAFTGAHSRRVGAIEEAIGGTLFLDEIGELPASVQAKLLRVLENRRVRRLGSNQEMEVDIRVVAATHRDLRADVNTGRFREDLYFRLAVVNVRLPPLRDRVGDIADLARKLLQRFGVQEEEISDFLSPPLMAELESARWRGNVRELRNSLERRWIFRGTQMPDLSEPPAGSSEEMACLPYDAARKESIEAFEHRYVDSLMRIHKGSIRAALESSKMSRSYLYELLDQYGIKRPIYKR